MTGMSSEAAMIEQRARWPGADLLWYAEDFNEEFRAIPSWARYFVELGRDWPDDSRRRIAVVSTPCDSAAAGLIALGAMVRRLSQPGANEIGAHISRVRGLRPRHAGTLRHRTFKGHFVVSRVETSGSVWLTNTRDDSHHLFVDYHAGDWYFDGEGRVEVREGGALPWQGIYASLLPDDTSVHAPNLITSDSSICLVGRSTGKSAQKGLFGAARIRAATGTASLLDLLALDAFQPTSTVSRVRYVSSRAHQGSSELGDSGDAQDTLGKLKLARIVICDGGDAAVLALGSAGFEGKTIIAHLPRTDDVARLEAVAEMLAAKRNWYSPCSGIESLKPPAPPGVVVRTLVAR